MDMYAPEERKRLCDEVIAKMREEGLSGRKACIAVGVPVMTFLDWVDADDALSVQYARAQQAHAERLADELFDIQDAEPERRANKAGGDEVDPGDVQRTRNRIQVRQWFLEHRAEAFRNRLDLAHSGKIAHPEAQADLSKLSDDELETYIALQAKLEGKANA